LEGVRVAAAVVHSGDIGHAQAQLAGACLEGLLAVAFADFPEHVGPLGIAWEKHHPGFIELPARGVLLLKAGEIGLALADGAHQLFLRFAAVEGHTQLARHLAQLAQGHPGQR